jgi:endonuclease/exonuclease/phosphatase family metal-dependent hydrolase
MKLITLNIWGGRIAEPLKDFFQQNSSVDIFCLQEVYTGQFMTSGEKRLNFSNIEALLGETHTGYSAPAVDYPDGNSYGLAIFIKKELKVKKAGDLFVYGWRHACDGDDCKDHPRNLQYITIAIDDKELVIANLHGIWTPKGKIDTPERITQSEDIKKFLNQETGAIVLGGDFNLLPDTQSLRILEADMRNLVKEYSIASTRTHYYPRPDKFADYMLVSDKVDVKNFGVMPDAVSDHSPLILEFSTL